MKSIHAKFLRNPCRRNRIADTQPMRLLFYH
nr:MAG TPA: hypothetical protein [Bacteriophage sp.]